MLVPSCIGVGNDPLQLCLLLDALSARIFPSTPLLQFYAVLHTGGKSRAFRLRVLRFRAALFASGECNRPRVIRATGGQHL